MGADVIGVCDRDTLAVQCKCYAELASIGPPAVQEIHAAKTYYEASAAAVVYRGRPTRSARELAKKVSVHLFHFDELKPGWVFDRTERGAQIRREAELRKAREQAEQRREEKERYEQLLAAYKANHAAWLKRKNSYDGNWKGPAAVTAIIGVIALFSGVGIAVSVGLFAFAYWAHFEHKPGEEPSPPYRPSWMGLESPSAPAARIAPPIQKLDNAAALGAAKKLESSGYKVTRASGQWTVTSPKTGTQRCMNEDSLMDLSTGVERLTCLRCYRTLKVPAGKRLHVKCPCGWQTIFESEYPSTSRWEISRRGA
jgi:hypothetical protein